MKNVLNAFLFICFACQGLAPVSADAADKVVKISAEDMADWKKDFGTWKVVGGVEIDKENEKKFTFTEGKGILANGVYTRNIFSAYQHGDVQAHIEFMVPKRSNSGVYFQGRYEIQILDSFGKEKVGFGDCGGIYQRWGKKGGFEGHGATVNASLAPGEWQTFDVTFRAPRFDKDGKKTANAVFVKVVHNGKVVHENVEVTGPTRAAAFNDEKPLGMLMLQGDHGPVAYRNIQLTGLITRPDPNKEGQPLKWHAATDKEQPPSIAGPSTIVIFENKMDSRVRLNWAGYRRGKKLQAFGEIEPGKTKKMKTFAGNTWVISDLNDKPLGHFVAGPNTARAVIPGKK